MAKTVRISSILALILVGAMLAIWAGLAARVDPRVEKILRSPGVLERYRRAGGSSPDDPQNEMSPLVRQAKVYAAHLNPPQSHKNEAAVPAQSAVPTPKVRTAATSQKFVFHTPKFTLHGTCYYPSRPEESIALLWQPGGGGGRFSWVRRGARLGHFVVEEIKRNTIIYGGGEQKHVMKVQRTSARPSLVWDHRTDAGVTYDATPVPLPVAVNTRRFLPEVGGEETTEEVVSGRYSPLQPSFRPP